MPALALALPIHRTAQRAPIRTPPLRTPHLHSAPHAPDNKGTPDPDAIELSCDEMI
jgi:hypothetical protein